MTHIKEKQLFETLNILKGQTALPGIYRKMQVFLRKKYRVTAVDFLLEQVTIANKIRYRLNILLATEEDYKKVHCEGDQLVYNKTMQDEIKEEFLRLDKGENFVKKEKRSGFFVTYNNFSQEIKLHMVEQCKGEISKAIKQKYAANNIWQLSFLSGSVFVFFYTDSDLTNAKQAGVCNQIKLDCFDILKTQDEFHVFSFDNFAIYFDSKQNVDENYKGNLWYYFK